MIRLGNRRRKASVIRTVRKLNLTFTPEELLLENCPYEAHRPWAFDQKRRHRNYEQNMRIFVAWHKARGTWWGPR